MAKVNDKKYSQGKIYKIECLKAGNESLIYIGSTTKKYLSQRLVAHRKNYLCWKNGAKKFMSSYEVFDKHGLEHCTITLLESVDAKTMDELRSREAFYIRNTVCVNKNIPNRTLKQYKLDHPEQTKQHEKKYYLKNREEILAKQKVVHQCECGSTLTIHSKARHLQSIKHQEFEKAQQPPNN